MNSGHSYKDFFFTLCVRTIILNLKSGISLGSIHRKWVTNVFFYNFLNNTHFRWKNIYTTLIQRKLLFHLLPLYHFRILSFYFTNLNYTKYSIFEIKDHLVYTSQTCSWIVPEYSMLREIYIKKLKYFSWNGPTTMKMCSLLN